MLWDLMTKRGGHDGLGHAPKSWMVMEELKFSAKCFFLGAGMASF